MTKRMWAAVLALTMLIAAFPASMAFAENRTTRCNLRLRASATSDSDTLVVIPGGTEISVLGTSGGWTKTSYNGHTGYISTSHLMDLTRSGYFPLKEGDESPYVQDLQQKLRDLGYFTGSCDGKYEASTTKAVTEFQKANGIGADGVAGGETQRIMNGDMAKGVTNTTTTTNTALTAETEKSITATATASGTTLRMGDRGDSVKTLQARLIELGYLTGKADGIFGAATQKAVIAFQKNSSLSSDGKAGNVTQNLLYSSSAKTASGAVSGSTQTDSSSTDTSTVTGNYKTLKRGMTSNDVKTMQQKLRDLGFMTAGATGFYGSATQAAVESFQKANNLSADGIAGPATQAKLFGNDASKAGSTSTDVTNTKDYSTLKQGMKSAAVTTMQKKLRELGYMTANATGYYGTATKAAVVAFQKKNGLSADGVAGSATLAKLYDGSPSASDPSTSASVPTSDGTGKISGPSSSSVKLLHWFDSVKPSLKTGSTLQIYDPATSYAWKLRAMSLGRHCDSEPLTAEDTYYMNQAFGNKTTWTPKIVYIKLPSGTWTMATMHNTPHLSGSISGNNFDGHLCVHFLRDMAEVTKNDPKYGVQNQNALREGWKKLTGQTID